MIAIIYLICFTLIEVSSLTLNKLAFHLNEIQFISEFC